MSFATNTLTRRAAKASTVGFSFLKALAVWKQRRALAALDDSRLADIGLTRQEALAEANRPVWDAPDHWFDRS